MPLVAGAPLLWKEGNTRTAFDVRPIRHHRRLEATCNGHVHVHVVFWTRALARLMTVFELLFRARDEGCVKASHGDRSIDRARIELNGAGRDRLDR